jgi:hypothetical protein
MFHYKMQTYIKYFTIITIALQIEPMQLFHDKYFDMIRNYVLKRLLQFFQTGIFFLTLLAPNYRWSVQKKWAADWKDLMEVLWKHFLCLHITSTGLHMSQSWNGKLKNSCFFNMFFGVTCPFWLSLLFLFFCHQVVHLIHLVFRWTREWNPRLRTMAQTVSPRCSPLDQGASPKNFLLPHAFITRFLKL